MTVAHLSQEWLDLRAELGASLPSRPGATARVQTVVSKTPAGDVAFVEAYEDGRLVAAAMGANEAADYTVNLTHADSLAIARGELDLHAGFMQGRVKVVGDMGKLMALLPVTRSDEYAAATTELARRSEV